MLVLYGPYICLCKFSNEMPSEICMSMFSGLDNGPFALHRDAFSRTCALMFALPYSTSKSQIVFAILSCSLSLKLCSIHPTIHFIPLYPKINDQYVSPSQLLLSLKCSRKSLVTNHSLSLKHLLNQPRHRMKQSTLPYLTLPYPYSANQ